MEVQHTSQAPNGKKKARGYLFCFITVYLAVLLAAVTCHFWQQRVEHRRETDYMHALAADLMADTAGIRETIQFNEGISRADSSLLHLLHLPEKNDIVLHKILILNPITQNFNYQINDAKTFDLLNHSGDIGLMRNKKVLDKVAAYYRQIELIEIFRSEIQDNLVRTYNLSFKVFDQYTYDNYMIPSAALITSDQSLILEYSNMLHNLIISYRMFNRMLRGLKSQAAELIALIGEEYPV